MGYDSTYDMLVFLIIMALVMVLAYLGFEWLFNKLVEVRAERKANKGISKHYVAENEGRL